MEEWLANNDIGRDMEWRGCDLIWGFEVVPRHFARK
jgi:hypothetical protein